MILSELLRARWENPGLLHARRSPESHEDRKGMHGGPSVS